MACLGPHGSGRSWYGCRASGVLAEDMPDGGTRMTGCADVVVSDTITSLASRMMQSVSKKITNNFIGCVRGILEA